MSDSPKEEPEALPGGTKTDEPSAVPDPEESGPVPHPEESVYPSGQQDGETGAAADEPEETPQDTPDLSEQMLYPPRASRTRNASQNRQSSNNTNGRRAAAQNKPAANAPKRKSGRGASTRASNTKASKIAGHQAQSLLDPPLHAEIDWTGKTRCPCAQTDDSEVMIACDICESWQHIACVGFTSEKEIPQDYACPWCKPDMHPLGFLKQTRNKPRARSARSSATGPESARSASPPSLQFDAINHGHQRNSRSTAAKASHPMPTSPDTPHFSTAGMSQKEAAAAEAREKSARRRSTMNSRDAAYEANLAEALRLSKAAAGIKESSPMPDLQASYRDEAGASSVDQNQHLELKREFDPSLQGPDALNEEHAGAGPDQRAYTEDPAQYTTSDWQVDKTNRASSASALENGKRRRNSTDAVGMAPEPGPSKRRKSCSQSPINEDEETLVHQPTENGFDPEGEAMEMDNGNLPATSKKPGRGGNRRGGKGGGKKGKGAANAHALNSEQVEDEDKLFTRHGSNQYASRVKPVPRSKISPHKRPPIHRGPHANGHASEDPVSLVQTVPDHLSHLAHIIPQETLQGPSSEGPFVSEGGHTKIRFPGRRMTMPEMRKRTKAMLDYLARVQVEMAERESRNAARVASNSGSVQTTPGSASEPLTEKKSLSMMDGLSRDIIRFQERFLNTS